jgi:nicotinamidase-related amidase
MPVTTLDPRTALIVIDLQQAVVAMPTAHPVAPVIDRAAALIQAFRRHHRPVILVTVTGRAPGRTDQRRATTNLPPNAADLIPELDRQPTDHIIAKQSWGAFTNTGLTAHLQTLRTTQIVLAGIATSTGVESTARQAHELGLNVTLATDAMTDSNPDAHHNSLTRIFPRLGETGTTDEIIALLDRAQA